MRDDVWDSGLASVAPAHRGRHLWGARAAVVAAGVVWDLSRRAPRRQASSVRSARQTAPAR
jgi:hypothetical protein